MLMPAAFKTLMVTCINPMGAKLHSSDIHLRLHSDVLPGLSV